MIQRLALIPLLLAAAMGALSGCSTVQPRCTSAADTPEHHYLMGMRALEEGNGTAAREKFERALYCDERFSTAHAGLAIAVAQTTGPPTDAKPGREESRRVTDELDKARKYAERPDQQFDYYAAIIRSNTLMKPEGWLNEAEDAFGDGGSLTVTESGLPYYQGAEALAYFMGVAWLEGNRFQKARDSFAAVLSARRDGKWREKADRGWKRADRVMRAMGGTAVGDVARAIAVQDRVSRADLCALLIDELNVEKLLAGRVPLASQPRTARFLPADLTGHPFREEVMTLLKWDVRGMEPRYDETTRSYLFKPADSVTRGEMAFILEDILIRLTGDEQLATRYFGHERSPFPDVRPSSSLYNAVMNVTTRSIMESELSGEFRVNDPVDGAEALLAIRVLKQKMNGD